MLAIKKPRYVEVRRWTINDNDDRDSFGNDHMANWLGRYYQYIDGRWLHFLGATGQKLAAHQGDYIARQQVGGGNWDYWPIAPDIFNETYQVVESESADPDSAQRTILPAEDFDRLAAELDADSDERGPSRYDVTGQDEDKIDARLAEAEAYAKEGWDWLAEALDALGVRDVFEMRKRFGKPADRTS